MNVNCGPVATARARAHRFRKPFLRYIKGQVFAPSALFGPIVVVEPTCNCLYAFLLFYRATQYLATMFSTTTNGSVTLPIASANRRNRSYTFARKRKKKPCSILAAICATLIIGDELRMLSLIHRYIQLGEFV